MFMFGEAMSIRARSTCSPSANSPARMRGEHREVLVDRSGAVRAVGAGLRQRAAMPAHLLGRQAVDVGLSLLDQMHGVLVELLEVVRRVVQPLRPVEAEPADVGLDRVDVLDVFLGRIRIVEPQVARPAELGRDAEIEADRLRMADVEVAVRLRRKAGRDPPLVPARLPIGRDDRTNEIERRSLVADRVGTNGIDGGTVHVEIDVTDGKRELYRGAMRISRRHAPRRPAIPRNGSPQPAHGCPAPQWNIQIAPAGAYATQVPFQQ